MSGRIVWWGRSDHDYARNRVIRGLLDRMGFEILDFRPILSAVGDIEARFSAAAHADVIWVPCFRQRDLGAALRFGRLRDIPVIADPLISAWDKQVFERRRFTEDSAAARRLRQWESDLFRACEVVIADTPAHQRFFASRLGVAAERTEVIWVGAEEDLFRPIPARPHQPTVEALFVGSFIGLHGIGTVIEAARLSQGAPVRWTLLGNGPGWRAAEEAARGIKNVRFETSVPYGDLPARIASADILLGVFGASDKAGRVIPNKVFQALACGRPVVTRSGEGYPPAALDPDCGIRFVPPDDPDALAAAVTALAADASLRERLGRSAAECFRANFGAEVLQSQLAGALRRTGLT